MYQIKERYYIPVAQYFVQYSLVFYTQTIAKITFVNGNGILRTPRICIPGDESFICMSLSLGNFYFYSFSFLSHKAIEVLLETKMMLVNRRCNKYIETISNRDSVCGLYVRLTVFIVFVGMILLIFNHYLF